MDLREAIELLKKDNNQLIETDILVDPQCRTFGSISSRRGGGNCDASDKD